VRADEYAGGYIIAESPLDLLKYAADVVADTAARIDRNEVLRFVKYDRIFTKFVF